VATLTFRALLLCSLALAVGCSKKAPQAVEKVAVEEKKASQAVEKVAVEVKKAPQAIEKVVAVEEKSTPQAPVTEDDFKILDVVLMDLLDFEDVKTWNHVKDATTKIVLDPMTAGSFDLTAQHQFSAEVTFYSHKEQADPVELGDDLRRRNPEKPISLAGYKSPSPKILVEKLISEKLISPATGEEISEEAANAYRFRITGMPSGSHFVIAWLPGYSKDGNTAVFRAPFGPSPHGATLTYKLAKKDGKWTVVWRDVAFYL
jgi:hypothetical protein